MPASQRSGITPLRIVCLLIAVGSAHLYAADVTARLVTNQSGTGRHQRPLPPAAIWLNPLSPGSLPAVVPGTFTLLQKNKMFTPHLLIVPIGSSVVFPNEDPFFHNVFSLFDGKRFDLGLYEEGSKRTVVFSREGVSYIFCNIHSEMSAVVIALTTPLYDVADAQGAFVIKNVPAGDYELQVWVEGEHQNLLDRQARRVHIDAEPVDLGDIRIDPPSHEGHLNKFGRPYEPESKPDY